MTKRHFSAAKGFALDHQETLSSQEARLLLQQIDEPRDKAIVLLFFTTGLFLNELLAITLTSIDWTKKELSITGKRPRVLPLDEPTFDALCLWSKARVDTTTDLFFITTKGKVSPLSERSIDHLIRKYADKAGISHPVNVHTLRQSHTISLLKKGLSKEEVATKLGITDRETLTRYQSKLETSSSRTTANEPSLDTRTFTEKLFKPTPNEGKTLCQPHDIQVPPEVIFGRDSLLKDLKSSIYHNQPTILIGQIGIGKTHILKHLTTQYPDSLYIPSSHPTKPFLTTLAEHLNPDWEKELGTRASASTILDWILQNSSLKIPLLLLDDCHTLTTNDLPLFLKLLDHEIPVVMASTKPLDKLPKLQWRLKVVEVKELSDDASQELINYLTEGLSITDDAMLETRMMSLGNGVPAAIVEMARQLRYHPVITPEVVRKIYHEAGIRYRDWTPAIVFVWAAVVCSRFVALGMHSYEGYILAGLGTTFLMVGKFFLMKMR